MSWSYLNITGAMICTLMAGMLAAVWPHSVAAQDAPQETSRCENALTGARMDVERDLLIAHYDIRPDVDDLHAIAAFATILGRHGNCFDWRVVVGTYGTQSGEYIHAPQLLDLAFGDRWSDAHNRRGKALAAMETSVRSTLLEGGSVWIAEGGQSDFTADLLTALRRDPDIASILSERLKIIQHSEWNESTTTPGALAAVQAMDGYLRIPDGNADNNGSPDFAIDDPSWWPALLRDENVGAIWREAKRLADLHNPEAAYINPHVAADGLDFSDTAEIAYILGFDGIPDHNTFFERFLTPSTLAPAHDTIAPVVTRWLGHPAMLVFSKTQEWRHNEGIAGADLFLTQLAEEHGWSIYTTENGAIFTPEILSRFDLVVFNSMTGDALSPDQRQAFQDWLEEDGAWIGLHASGDASHTAWTWYDTTLIGPEFIGHPSRPQLQSARLSVLATDHPVMAGLPLAWEMRDEWYSFDSLPDEFGLAALLGIDEATYDPSSPDYGEHEDLRMGSEPSAHPLVWAGCISGSRTFYSAIGHTHRVYEEPNYRRLLGNAFEWVTAPAGDDECS